MLGFVILLENSEKLEMKSFVSFKTEVPGNYGVLLEAAVSDFVWVLFTHFFCLVWFGLVVIVGSGVFVLVLFV